MRHLSQSETKGNVKPGERIERQAIQMLLAGVRTVSSSPFENIQVEILRVYSSRKRWWSTRSSWRGTCFHVITRQLERKKLVLLTAAGCCWERMMSRREHERPFAYDSERALTPHALIYSSEKQKRDTCATETNKTNLHFQF